MPTTIPTQTQRTRHKMQAVLMRAGTSKGLFIHRHNLPENQNAWSAPLLAAMGSAYPDPKQIDGVGGATSVTSKVAVVERSTRPGVDVDYTFVQIGVGSQAVDFSGNCGNMASGVGPFAVQEGLVTPMPSASSITVRIFNTNTSRYLEETMAVDENGELLEEGDFKIPGVQGTGSEIKVAFLDPAGSMTKTLFPTGKRSETVEVKESSTVGHAFDVSTTIIDCANPFVFVDASTLPSFMTGMAPEQPHYLEVIESIRRVAAVRMGLAKDTTAASLVRGTPKIAVLYPPTGSKLSSAKEAQIHVQSFSMGKPHPSLQLTGAACLASCVSIEGTIAHELSTRSDICLPITPERTPSPGADHDMGTSISLLGTETLVDKMISITHSTGSIAVNVELSSIPGEGVHVDRCSVSRTARRLFEGSVYAYY